MDHVFFYLGMAFIPQTIQVPQISLQQNLAFQQNLPNQIPVYPIQQINQVPGQAINQTVYVNSNIYAPASINQQASSHGNQEMIVTNQHNSNLVQKVESNTTSQNINVKSSF